MLSHEAIYKVFIRSKGFHSEAMKTTCTKIILGSWLPKIIFVHSVFDAIAARPFERNNIFVQGLLVLGYGLF